MKSRFNPFLRPISFVAALTFALSSVSALAVPLHWDGNDTTANADGGSGPWDTTTTNWDTATTGGTNSAWTTFGNTDVANFGGTGGTVTLGANLGPTGAYPNAINVTAGNYVIDQAGFELSFRGTAITVSAGATLEIKGGTIPLQNNGSLSVSGNNALKISSKISGGIGVAKIGGGDVTLTNDTNDFTGNLAGQNGGNLYLSSIKNSGVASAAGAGSIVGTGLNNAIVYTGTGDSTNRTFNLFGGGDDTLKNNGTSGALVWTGAFSNTKTAASTLRFSGTNTAGNDFQGNLVNSGANILAVTKEEAGTWIFSGANTYTGTTTIAAGILRANQVDVAGVSSALGNGGRISFTGGTLQYSATSAGTDYSTRIFNNSAVIKIDTNGQNVAFGTALASTNTAGLTKEGAGQLELKMSFASYTGTTTINGGTLKFAGRADLDFLSSSSININNGASLVIYSDFNRTTLSNGKTFTFGNTGGGSIVYDKGNHLWQSSAGKFVTTGGTRNTISAANGGFINPQTAHAVNFEVADGSDAVDLLVSAPIGSGNYTKSGAGTLSITSFSTLGGGGVSQPNLTINEGVFDVGGPAQLTTVGQATGVVTSDILNHGVYRHSSSNSQTLAGVMSGTGALTQNGSGTLTLTSTSTYSGATLISGGTLLVNGNQSTATGAVTVDAAGTLGGIGTLGGATTVNGKLAPGSNAVGQLTFVTGGLTLGNLAANSLKFELGANTTAGTTYDTVATNTLAIGAGTLDFADFQFTDTGTLAAGAYTLISSGAAITGSIGTASGTIGAFSATLSISGGNTLILTVSSDPYTTWANTFLPGDDVSNPIDDNDNDGLSNQQEFAFGLSPISGSSVNPILVQLDKTTGTFTYQRRAATGLTYKILTSTTLVAGSWTEDVTATEGQVVTPSGSNETVVVTLTGAPLAATKLFVRVSAE